MQCMWFYSSHFPGSTYERKKQTRKATTQNTMTSWPVYLLQNLVRALARRIMVIGERIVRCMFFFLFLCETLVTIGLCLINHEAGVRIYILYIT